MAIGEWELAGSQRLAARDAYLRPSVIDETKQEFLGIRYYLCGRYFQRDGIRLHRVVYETNYGPIPKGMHVHHVNNDRSDNNPENLEIMDPSGHLAHHGNENRGLHSRRWRSGHGARVLKLAAEWHRSEEGRKWHRRHYERMGHLLHERRYEKQCEICGSSYKTADEKSRFCGRSCKAAERRRSGIDNEKRSCLYCGGAFTVNRYSRTATCSRSCSEKARREGIDFYETRHCNNCGSEMRLSKGLAGNKVYCGHRCRAEAHRSGS